MMYLDITPDQLTSALNNFVWDRVVFKTLRIQPVNPKGNQP